MEKYLYIGLIAFTFFGPLSRAFEPRIRYIQYWKSLLVATLAVYALFIPWDVFFTAQGHWGFTDRYVLGWKPLGLPIEEWLFFVVVPFACFFIYEVLNLFFPWTDKGQKWPRVVTWIVIGFSAFGAAFWADRAYPAATFFLLALALALGLRYRVTWLGPFLRAWGVSLVPFFMVNGVLTGTGLEEPIVWYNNEENSGIRLGTIPFEDAFYGMLMVFIYTATSEWHRKKSTTTPT
jgi:lycopene cyclase domain-containing protein